MLLRLLHGFCLHLRTITHVFWLQCSRPLLRFPGLSSCTCFRTWFCCRSIRNRFWFVLSSSISVSCSYNAFTISVNTETQIALPAHRRWVFSLVGHLYSSVGIPCSRNVSGPVNRRPLDNNQKPLDTPESKVGETGCD